jgi:anti-sigma-K factor RskA
MTPRFEHAAELVEEYALGLLDEAEAAWVVAHLEGCAECRALADEAQQTAALLATTAPPMEPSPETRDRLFERVRQARVVGQTRGRPAPLPRAPGSRQGARLPLPRFNPWPALAALNLGLAAALAVWGLALQTQVQTLSAQNQALSEQLRRQEVRLALVSQATAQVMDLAGTESAPGLGGRAYLDHNTGTVWVTLRGLPEVQADETLQLWLIRPDGPVSAGVFAAADGQGEVWLTGIDYLGEVSAVGVSREQTGGSPTPTDILAVGGPAG